MDVKNSVDHQYIDLYTGLCPCVDIKNSVDHQYLDLYTGLCPCVDVKPVLNLANICFADIVRSIRRTLLRFLTELIVRRTWFGQFGELYFVIN